MIYTIFTCLVVILSVTKHVVDYFARIHKAQEFNTECVNLTQQNEAVKLSCEDKILAIRETMYQQLETMTQKYLEELERNKILQNSLNESKEVVMYSSMVNQALKDKMKYIPSNISESKIPVLEPTDVPKIVPVVPEKYPMEQLVTIGIPQSGDECDNTDTDVETEPIIKEKKVKKPKQLIIKGESFIYREGSDEYKTDYIVSSKGCIQNSKNGRYIKIESYNPTSYNFRAYITIAKGKKRQINMLKTLADMYPNSNYYTYRDSPEKFVVKVLSGHSYLKYNVWED